MMESGKKSASMLIAMLAFAGCSGVGSGTSTQALCTMNSTDPCCPGSPIVLDLEGDGIHLTGAEDGVTFMLRPGQFGLWAWTMPGSDDAFLVLDKDNSGRIDNGEEMFGDGSVQLASSEPNGFSALAYYDLESQGGNHDGVIDARDAVWPRLRLWRDADHDGFSASYELTPLDDAGVHMFSLDSTKSSGTDEHGNEFRFTSTIVADAPISTTVSDVWLTQRPLPRDDDDGDGKAGRTQRDYVEWTCWSWAYAVQYSNSDPSNPGSLKICDVPGVSGTGGDPIATSYYQFARLIARSSVSTDKSTAFNHAYNFVTNILASGIPSCLADRFPQPDPYLPTPYDDDGGGPTYFPRVKCFSKTIHTGGGGGCALPDPSTD